MSNDVDVESLKMSNMAKESRFKCLEWTVPSPSSYYYDRYRIENISFLDSKCCFEFASGSLYFEHNGEMKWPMKVTVFSNFNNVSEINILTNSTDSTMKIWKYESSNMRSISSIDFKVIIYVDFSKEDKAVQTPPYIDRRFLPEHSSKHFATLLDKGPSHDVEFLFEDQTIKAHKQILCCRSNVFSSMLQSDMIEGETGRVNIQDTEPTIFSQFLRCLYTGMLPELTVDIAMQLYRVADKYSVIALKQQFANFLIDNLSVRNACEILVMADQHSDQDLKTTVIDYAFKEKIPRTGEKWTDFCNENPKLAIEVLNLFYEQLCDK